MRDNEEIVHVAKNVICKVKSGKFGEINLINEAVRYQSDAVHDFIDEVDEEEDMEPLPEVSNDSIGPSAADNAEAIPHTSNADNCLQLTSSEMIIPTDTAGVNEL